ncbi:MAG: hypothetical protein RCG15_03050 [Candidatus Rickettsia vulgarisii]
MVKFFFHQLTLPLLAISSVKNFDILSIFFSKYSESRVDRDDINLFFILSSSFLQKALVSFDQL